MVRSKHFPVRSWVALLVELSACGSTPDNASAQSSRDQTDQITGLKEKLWAAIREKNAPKFIDC
jgi:hypothetical protein